MTELEETILSLEKNLISPEVRKSAEKLAAIISESFFEFGSSGQIYHYHKGDVFDSGPAKDMDWEILDFSVMPLAGECALATYKAVKHSEPDESKKISLRCSLWEKESGNWKLKFHQGAYANESHAALS